MSTKRTPRRFVHERAARKRQRAFISFIGASGGGKTKSALEFATGITSVAGGQVFGVDAENGRMLKYAPAPGEAVVPGRTYDFVHVPFEPPFDPESYLDALRYCEGIAGSAGGVVIFDSMSHEHAGPGGRLDASAEEADRLAEKSRYNKDPNAHRFSAFRVNSDGRRDLLWAGFLRSNLHVILCFRAKESYEQVGSKIINVGYSAVGGQEFIFEADCSILFMPGAKGVPTWQSDKTGEAAAIKLPQEYTGIIDDGRAISAAHGAKVARWLLAGGAPTSAQSQSAGVTHPSTHSAVTGGAGDPQTTPAPPLSSGDDFLGDRPARDPYSPHPEQRGYNGQTYDPTAPCSIEPAAPIMSAEDKQLKAWAATLRDMIQHADDDEQRRRWNGENAADLLRLSQRSQPLYAWTLHFMPPDSVGSQPADGDAPEPVGGADADGGRVAASSQREF